MEKTTWVEAVVEDCLDFENEFPGLLDEIATYEDKDLEDLEKSEKFYKAATRIVEPKKLQFKENEAECTWYNNRQDSEGNDFVIGAISDLAKFKQWCKVIALLNKNGY